MSRVSTGALLMASLEGQTLGQYRVIEQMGSGGMATVYKAYHPRLDRYVAIKMLHEAFQEDKNFLARFEREAQIVARLEHPHIVQVFDFDEYNGRPYLVMKYIEGRTLKAELESAPLTLDDIIRIMTPVADALDYAHRRGVLHRDIKPSNIIIDSTGVAYVTDFGLARMAQLGDSTLSHDVLLGTPHYISPEQAMATAIRTRAPTCIRSASCCSSWSSGACPSAPIRRSPSSTTRFTARCPSQAASTRRSSPPSMPCCKGAGESARRALRDRHRHDRRLPPRAARVRHDFARSRPEYRRRRIAGEAAQPAAPRRNDAPADRRAGGRHPRAGARRNCVETAAPPGDGRFGRGRR
ncbi:MAG: protein kinase [Anaerolineae bacterium]